MLRRILTGVFRILGSIFVDVSYLFWFSLAYITLYYSIFGFIVGSSTFTSAFPFAFASAGQFANALASNSKRYSASAFLLAFAIFITITNSSASAFVSSIAVASAFAGIRNINIAITIAIAYCLLLTIILGLEDGWIGVAVGVVTWILCILFILAYFYTKKKLEKESVSESDKFCIIAGASLLGVFLGWVGYQIFPFININMIGFFIFLEIKSFNSHTL
ncbi:MAG: hypothetical protein F6K62_05880 [Sphaerospermopsis sp. SIO1G2]|nr:hypothetical protein [Sphaerospermopsis sp. SIO1G2]